MSLYPCGYRKAKKMRFYTRSGGIVEEFEKKMCSLIASHYPVNYSDVVRIFFVECDRSFDRTIALIEARIFWNEYLVKEVEE